MDRNRGWLLHGMDASEMPISKSDSKPPTVRGGTDKEPTQKRPAGRVADAAQRRIPSPLMSALPSAAARRYFVIGQLRLGRKIIFPSPNLLTSNRWRGPSQILKERHET